MPTRKGRRHLGAAPAWALGLGLGLLPARSAAELQLGGSLGFGMTLRKQAGVFAWDWDSAREDTTLAELKLRYAPLAGLDAFVRFGARLDAAFQDEEAPKFELHEASLLFARAVRGDSLGLRLFARQPGSLWLDHGLGAPVSPLALGEDVQGLRAGLQGKNGLLLLLAADGSGSFSGAEGADERLLLLRFRGDKSGRLGLRIGGTFLRHDPAMDPQGAGVVRRDQLGVDVRAFVGGVLAQADYSVLTTEAFFPPALGTSPPTESASFGASGGPLTEEMSEKAALRAELRAPRLGNTRWGWVGFAPSYRAIGAEHEEALLHPGPEPGSPRRGLEGHRLEAWYELPQWPVWLRYAYDREVQFRDASRRVLRQESEIEAPLLQDVGGRVLYTQSRVRDETDGNEEHFNDLLLELRAADGPTRLRAQWAAFSLDTPERRDAFILEGGLRLSSRLQTLARATWARVPDRLHRSFFVAVQYWHLPHFEMALQYGPDWIGDRSDPVLDADVLTADLRDVLRLHLRGWF